MGIITRRLDYSESVVQAGASDVYRMRVPGVVEAGLVKVRILAVVVDKGLGVGGAEINTCRFKATPDRNSNRMGGGTQTHYFAATRGQNRNFKEFNVLIDVNEDVILEVTNGTAGATVAWTVERELVIDEDLRDRQNGVAPVRTQ